MFIAREMHSIVYIIAVVGAEHTIYIYICIWRERERERERESIHL